MTTFYLIRHALNDLIGRSIAGRMPGVHLNAAGREQAERLAARLEGRPIDRIYCSPLERAREKAAEETTRMASGLGLPPGLGLPGLPS